MAVKQIPSMLQNRNIHIANVFRKSLSFALVVMVPESNGTSTVPGEVEIDVKLEVKLQVEMDVKLEVKLQVEMEIKMEVEMDSPILPSTYMGGASRPTLIM